MELQFWLDLLAAPDHQQDWILAKGNLELQVWLDILAAPDFTRDQVLAQNYLEDDRAASDILGNAEDSDDAYSCIMMGEEAGGLLCSLTEAC